MASSVTTSTSQTSQTDDLEVRLREVRSRITAKASQLGLATEPTLIVVSKNHPANLVEQLIGLGERDFGENRDQEAKPKALAVSERLSNSPITWHFVGQLQSNKVKSVLTYANWIHTLDRDSLLTEMAKRTSDRTANPVNVFIEVNLTDRVDRGGVDPAALMQFASRVSDSPGLNLVGLMAVARPEVDPRIDFERVANLHSRFLAEFPDANLLSMGMSGDYLEAMEYGATHLRIGTAITGPRPSQT